MGKQHTEIVYQRSPVTDQWTKTREGLPVDKILDTINDYCKKGKKGKRTWLKLICTFLKLKTTLSDNQIFEYVGIDRTAIVKHRQNLIDLARVYQDVYDSVVEVNRRLDGEQLYFIHEETNRMYRFEELQTITRKGNVKFYVKT